MKLVYPKSVKQFFMCFLKNKSSLKFFVYLGPGDLTCQPFTNGQLSNNLLGFFLQFSTASSPVLFRASHLGSIWPFLIPNGHKNAPTQLCLNRKAPTFYGGWFWETNMGDFRRQIRSWDWPGSWEGWRWPSAWAIRNDW